jgi:hypothetical protein
VKTRQPILREVLLPGIPRILPGTPRRTSLPTALRIKIPTRAIIKTGEGAHKGRLCVDFKNFIKNSLLTLCCLKKRGMLFFEER